MVLLSPWRLWAIEDNQECTWQVVLNKFDMVGKSQESDRFFNQEPLDTVDSLFGLLVDSPIDPDEVRGRVRRTGEVLDLNPTELWTFAQLLLAEILGLPLLPEDQLLLQGRGEWVQRGWAHSVWTSISPSLTFFNCNGTTRPWGP